MLCYHYVPTTMALMHHSSAVLWPGEYLYLRIEAEKRRGATVHVDV